MKRAPLISILLPVHNAARWLADTVASALSQTRTNLEVIVVDDGSTDGSLAIARSFYDRRIKVFSQTHSGASAARNTALQLAKGDYIQWLDADDLLLPGKVAEQMQLAVRDEDGLDLLCGPWGRFYRCAEMARYEPTDLWQDLTPSEWLYRKIDRNLWMAPESWLVSRRLTEAVGGWDETLLRDNDGDYFNRVVAASKRVRFVPWARSLHRVGVRGISTNATLSGGKIESICKSILRHVELMLSMEDSERTREACSSFLDRWLIYVYPERPDLYLQLVSLMRGIGGEPSVPQLRRKYRWMRSIVGWKAAKRAQWTLPFLRTRIESVLERPRCALRSRRRPPIA